MSERTLHRREGPFRLPGRRGCHGTHRSGHISSSNHGPVTDRFWHPDRNERTFRFLWSIPTASFQSVTQTVLLRISASLRFDDLRGQVAVPSSVSEVASLNKGAIGSIYLKACFRNFKGSHRAASTSIRRDRCVRGAESFQRKCRIGRAMPSA